MKILVVVNNHNSLGVIKLCLKLRALDNSVEVKAICNARNLHTHGEFFKLHQVPWELFDLHSNAHPSSPAQGGLINNIKNMQKQSHVDGRQGAWGTALRGLKAGITRILFASSANYIARETLIRYRMKKYQGKAINFLQSDGVDIICALSDRSHDYVEGPILWAAKRLGIKVVLPYIAQFDVDASLQYRCDAHGKPLPGLVPFRPPSVYTAISYFKFRKQMHKGFFFQEPYLLNAARKCGILSDYPWWVGNGNSDVACVDSDFTAKKYVDHRVDPGKVVVMGHVDYDVVFQSKQNSDTIRAQLFDDYQLDPNKKLIILSMPQYAEQGYITWDAHWKEINGILAAIAAADLNVVVSIHPRSDNESYRYIEREHDFHITDQPLADVIGAGDLFMASNSTTFCWAVLCGIPSIALNSPVVFLYDHLSTVIPEYNNSKLTAKIDQVVNQTDISFEKDWALLSKDVVFDGQFHQRFLQMLQDACRTGNRVRTPRYNVAVSAD